MKYNTGLDFKWVTFYYRGKVILTECVRLSYPAERDKVYPAGREIPEKKY